MKYCFYTRPPGESDYNRFFNTNEPIEVHIKSKDWNNNPIYLVKKHKDTRSGTHATIDSQYKQIESYTGNSLQNSYRQAASYFLWLKESEMIWLESNTKSKHVLQRWDD